MAAVFTQLIAALSVFFSIAGSSDVISVVGGSVQLEINGSVSEFYDFSWTFSGSVNVLKYSKKYKDIIHSPRYKDRVEFIEETCSLILKNLQKTDNGLYEVKASNAEKTTSATYTLSVLDPVEAPDLTVYNSTDPCNFTLTCRGHDLSITSSCYKDTCEEKEVTSPGGVALSLSVRDSIIICNHSNPASWKQENITFKHLCDTDPVEPPVLTVQNSTDPCNITLTCRGHDLSITSSCYKDTCEEKEVTSQRGVTLSLSVRDSIIICNHSNLVSWKQENKIFKHLCDDTEPPTHHSGLHWLWILPAVGILGVLVAGYLCWKKQNESPGLTFTDDDVNRHWVNMNKYIT